MNEFLRRWAFDPIDTASMAMLRIACGVLTVGWAVSYLPDVTTFLSADGVTSQPSTGGDGWWSISTPHPYLWLTALIAAGVGLTVGWHSRVMAVAVAFGLLVLQRRDVYVLNSGDLLLRELAILVALMPSGEIWSLDFRRRVRSAARRGLAPVRQGLRSPWGLRLLQLQISGLYLFSVLDKLHGDPWQSGVAVGEALQLEDLQRVRLPQSLATSVTFVGVLTYGTLIIEASLVLGLWFRRTRYWVMLGGVAIHLGIEGTLLIGWFSLTVIACYLAFVPPADVRRVLREVRRRHRARNPRLVPASTTPNTT